MPKAHQIIIDFNYRDVFLDLSQREADMIQSDAQSIFQHARSSSVDTAITTRPVPIRFKYANNGWGSPDGIAFNSVAVYRQMASAYLLQSYNNSVSQNDKSIEEKIAIIEKMFKIANYAKHIDGLDFFSDPVPDILGQQFYYELICEHRLLLLDRTPLDASNDKQAISRMNLLLTTLKKAINTNVNNKIVDNIRNQIKLDFLTAVVGSESGSHPYFHNKSVKSTSMNQTLAAKYAIIDDAIEVYKTAPNNFDTHIAEGLSSLFKKYASYKTSILPKTVSKALKARTFQFPIKAEFSFIQSELASLE